jgi:hypothetical protein
LGSVLSRFGFSTALLDTYLRRLASALLVTGYASIPLTKHDSGLRFDSNLKEVMGINSNVALQNLTHAQRLRRDPDR